MKILLKNSSAEITEKKSRFIASIAAVTTQSEADDFIADIKKKYWDARHNCSALVLGDRGEFTRCSDDGEPAGTAGRPMLSVLTGDELTNVCAVVTRYFGGVLLGTGGLVRAYSKAVQEALAAGSVSERIDGFRLAISTDYNSVGKIRYILEQRQIPILDTIYTDSVQMEVLTEAGMLAGLKDEITDKTGAKALFIRENKVRYALDGGKPILL